MPAFRCVAILWVHDVIIRVVECHSTALTDHTDLLPVPVRGLDQPAWLVPERPTLGADLFGTNLSQADLREAKLKMVNLSFANLTGADLTGADVDAEDASP